jgi:UDP-perosamine 4-acetyltransferase
LSGPERRRRAGYDASVSKHVGRRVLLIGAGGHARVCLEALLDDGDTEVIGALSADGSGVPALGVPMLGRESDLRNITQRDGDITFCVAIGDNATRQSVAPRISHRVVESVTHAISRFAMISTTASCGDGVHLLPGSVVNAATEVGDGTIVNTNASIDHDGRIGAFVHVAPGAAIGGGVTIGDLAFVGIGARILPGLTIGAGARIGAGAVVIDDVEPGVTVVGVPARVIGPADGES